MPKSINNIHDKFTKQLFSDKELALAFLEENLPDAILKNIDLQSIEYINTSYISTKLKESFSDIVFRFKTEKGYLKICLLLEHKSYLDTTVAFQLLEYLALGYQTQLKNKTDLELIIPIIYYHGQNKWIYKDFASFFEIYPDELKAYLPIFRNEFIDLSKMDSDQILSLQNGMLRSALLIQRHYNDPKSLKNNLLNIVNSLNPYLEKNFIQSIFVYLLQNVNFEQNELKNAIAEFPTDLNNKIMSLYDQLILEGMEKGIEKGSEKKEIEIILNGFDKGYKIIDLVIISNLSEEKVMSILKENNRI